MSFAPKLTASQHPESYQQEVHFTSSESYQNDNLGEIYSIIQTLELVERSFIKDLITTEEYSAACSKLLTQYNTLLRAPSLDGFDIDAFVKKYWLTNVENAISRLQTGIPATIEHHSAPPVTREANSTNHKLVAEVTSNFITLMDALRLNFKSKDQLYPLLSDIMTNLNRVGTLHGEQRQKLVDWLIRLNKMKLTDELSDDELKQMLFDLEDSYNEFYKSLE